MNIPKTEELFDLTHTIAKNIFDGCEYPYEALPKIKDFTRQLFSTLGDDYEEISPEVYVHKTAVIAKTATIVGPTIIGENTEVRPGAFIRGAVIIGNGAVIGNSTEIKNAIIFDGAQLPHYNYVGDSIIGYKGHMGAGSIASNFRLDHNNITVRDGNEKLNTNLRKMGVLLADMAEIGCNSVLCPGSIIGRRCMVYPLSSFNGILAEGKTFSNRK